MLHLTENYYISILLISHIFSHEELEEFSCTAYTQAWGKEKAGIKEIYEAEPTTSFRHQPKSRIEENVVFSYKTNRSTDENNFERFVNCKSDALS